MTRPVMPPALPSIRCASDATNISWLLPLAVPPALFQCFRKIDE